MKNRTIAIIMAVVASGGDWCLPASAQSSIGGVKKQTPLAAPVKPVTLGGPVKPIEPAAPIKPIALGGPVKKVAVGQLAGSALMRDEIAAAAILEATVKAVRIPLQYNIELLAKGDPPEIHFRGKL